MNSHNTNETGAVLLTTLLLMTVMAALTLAIIDDIRFSIKYIANVQTAEQLDWYERGAEDYAQSWLTKTLGKDQTALTQIITKNTALTFPIEEGIITIQVRDNRNCYNVNGLAQDKTSDRERRQFSRLLKLLEFPPLQTETLPATLQDWVDSNSIPNQGGAEDFAYTNQTPPFHAANTLMVDITELRAVQGFTEEVFQALKPYVCAAPGTANNSINLNTLTIDQAPLLALLFGGDNEALETAQSVIAQRPAEGYTSPDQVWALDTVEDLKLKGAGKNMTRVTTDQVAFDINIQYQSQSRAHTAVFDLNGKTGATLIARRSR